MSHTNPVSRRAYHREFYWRHVEKRRRYANHRRQCKRWCAWLLAEIRALP